MSRRKAAPKRKALPDPVYKNALIAKFVNHVMVDGKKSLAERVVYGAFHLLEERLGHVRSDDDGGDDGRSGGRGSSAVVLFEKILGVVRPSVEVKSRRVGGSTYQVPIEVRTERGTALAMRWIIEAAKSRHETGMMKRLAGELYDAHEGRGNAMKKREDVHRMAKANQAFAHYRW